MKLSPQTLTLTKRDLKMFLVLAKYGALSTKQLEEIIFQGVQNSTMLRRLRRIERGGWIYRIGGALPSGELVWVLARKGEEAIDAEIPMVRPNRNGLVHDVLLSTLRMRLESIGLGENFVPEWSIRRQTFTPDKRRRKDNQLVPDGIFSAVLWNKTLATIALELEINAKTTQRYERIFTKYLEKNNLELIWYFVKTEGFAEALIAKWNHIKSKTYLARKAKSTLIVTVLSEFETSPREANIYFAGGDTCEIQEMFVLPKPQNKTAQAVGREPKENKAPRDELLAS